MATSSDGDSKRMYSWWWDSHISPKNSKWLQENLRDMDANVKAMIKLIEEDADSFAKRAELYFKKRPELMSLVEQFYRAYRALAERYDHATGVLHQAHRTMAEAFPGQVPLILPDDSIYTESTFAEEESDSLKGLNDILGPETPLKFVEDRVRKRLDFHEVEEKAQTSQSDEHHKAEAKEMDEFEKEIFILKEALAKLEADKETGFVRFQESLERLAKLESGFSEVQSLKEAITRIECEKEHSLLLYKQCLDRISNLENVLSYVQADAVKETQSLKQELAKLEAEKNDALDQQKRSLDMIHDLENKLRRTEDYAKDFSGKAAKAENEVEVLTQAIAKLTEHKISIAQEEVERLSGEINNGVSKLKNAEEQCFLLEKSNESLRFELKKLEQKMGCQKEELTEKQKELGRLWTCIQEERLCFVEAKTAFQTLQHLHSQAQDELRSLSSELENRTWILGEIEIRNQNFQEENTHLAAELESIRGKIKELESSCEYLAEEKSALLEENSSLLTQIQIMNEKNAVLENSVRDLSDDLEGLKTESKSLEDSYRLLLNQKAGLAIKNDNLISHLRDKEQRLKELQAFLDVEKRSQADFVQQRNKELEEEGEKLLEASKLLQKQVSELEQQNLELRKLEDVKTSLLKTEEENQKLAVEISVAVTLLEQVISEAKSIELEKNIIEQELALKTEQLFEMKKGLCAKVEGDRKGEEVCSQIDNLQRENSKILEEKVYLTKEISHSEAKNRLLEEENNLILIEKILVSLVFENYVDEKSIKLKELGGDFEKQCDINKALTEKLNMMKKTLQMSEDTLRATEISRDQLILEYANRKDCFSQKEMQLLEAEQKLNFTENEKRKLLNILEDQTRRFDEVKLTNENQEKQISCLCEDNDCLRYENVCLLEASQKLEAKLGQLHEEQEASKIQVETLLCELQEAKREIDICEKQAAASFCDLQVLNVYQDLFEEKVHELNEAIEGLEDERVLDIKLLNQRVGVLEGENEGLKAQLAAYSGQNLEIKDAEFVNDFHESHPIKDQNASAIEEAEIKMEHQNPTAVTKLDLKSESRSRRNVKPLYEISLSENGLLTKDIMLDQMSECSSHGITGNEHVCTDNHMLELWETTDDVSTIDLNVGKAKKDIGYRRIEPAKKSVSDFQLEKQLGVDSLEIARRSVDLRREANKKKIIDRLNCDVQRLTNLQITVQDLKRKLEITEKNRRGKAVIESDNLKTQLEEAEESIFRFLELNGKLMKNIEDGLFSSGGGRCSSMESEEGGSVRRRRVSEQARRVTEKIGRLQLEVQKMQFVLLKLEDGRENKAGAGAGRYRVAEAKRRVVLRDYLYSGGRTSSQRKKKAPFCACVDPPTNGD